MLRQLTSFTQDLHIGTINPKQLSFSSPFTLRCTSARRTVARAFILYFDSFFTTSGEPVPKDTNAHAVKDGEVILAEVWPVGRSRSQRPMSPMSDVPSTPTSPVRGDKTGGEKPARAGMRRTSSYYKAGTKDGEKSKETTKSFTTGPQSVPTHWKQTLFLLREPITVQDGRPALLNISLTRLLMVRCRTGTVVSGTFHCRKSADNSRELDVEIHYRVLRADGEKQGPAKGSADSELLVQTFKVR